MIAKPRRALEALIAAAVLVVGVSGAPSSHAQLDLGEQDSVLIQGSRAPRGESAQTPVHNVARFKYLKRYQTRRPYPAVFEAVHQAILDRGMVITQAIDIRRTLLNAGLEAELAAGQFVSGETISVCDGANLSTVLRSNPHAIVLCPMAISIYVLTSAPDVVHVGFRRPTAAGGSPRLRTTLVAIETLLEEVVGSAGGRVRPRCGEPGEATGACLRQTTIKRRNDFEINERGP